MIPGSIRLLCSAALLMLAAVALEAGGWVVITLQDLPDHVLVGTPVTLTYSVRQHGMRLLGNLTGRIEARSGIDIVQRAAAPTSESGRYSATLTFPYAGAWTIDILSGFGGQFDGLRITLQALDPSRPAPAMSELERGQRLFVAKGCVTCHVHRAISGRSTSAGPELTAKRFAPEYLKRFLAHPPQAEPFEPGRWQMPDLELRDKDITSLVAFINTERPVENRVTAARRP